MSNVLMDWLRRRLGASIECNVENLGREFFDGKLYFKLLQSYKIVNDEYGKTLVTAHNAETAMKNLKQLCFWLKLLGVNHCEETMVDISNGESSACLRLLFELYVCLENRDTWFFVEKKKAEQMVRDPFTDKFIVTKTPFTMAGLSTAKVDETPLARPLYNRMSMVEEYREKLNKVLRRCRQDSQTRRDILCKLEQEERNKSNKEPISFPPKLSQSEILRTREEIRNFSFNLSRRKKDEVVDCLPEDYVSLLKVMRRKAEANRVLTGKMHGVLLNEIWTKRLEEEEKKFHQHFGQLLVKQSQFEKQTCLRLSQIHHQHRIFVDNKRILHGLAEEHQESANYFEDTYVVLRREEDEDAKKERLRVQKLHRVLFAQKQREKYERHYRMCYRVVEDITDVALKTSETVAEQGFPVSRKTMNEWKALFYKSLPIFLFEDEDTILAQTLKRPEPSVVVEMDAEEEEMEDETETESSSCTKEEKESLDYDYLIQLDLEAVDEVNEQNLHDYLYTVGPYRVELWPELLNETGDFEESQNVLGFVVHRLLEFKYPLPPPPQPPDLPSYSTKAILNNLNDQSAVEKLKLLLARPAVALVDIPTAMNYCIEEYIKYEDPEEIKEYLQKRGGAKTGRKQEPGKASAKVESKKESAKTKSSKKEKVPPEPLAKDVEVQVPSFIDLAAPRVRSTAELLGQQAVEILTIGETPTDILLIKCLVEYLKSLGSINGWVLLNYPTVCSQIELLEFTMTGLLPQLVCSSAGSDIKLYIDRERNLPLNEELLRLRSSKLVPRTTTRPPTPAFCPYFNKYIKMQTKTEAEKASKEKAAAEAKYVDSEDEIHFEQPILIEDSKPDGFYEDYGIFHNYIYSTFDLTCLKNLARTILGEDDVEDMRRKPSEDLFGTDILESLMAKKGKGKDEKKSASSKPSKSADSNKNKGNKSPGPTKSVSLVEVPEPIVEEEEEMPAEVVPQPPPQYKPGESGWLYTELPVQGELQIILASTWENIETAYLNCLKEIFFMYRVQNSVVVPYRNYVRTIMEEIVSRPDNRQKYVTEVQTFMNDIIPDELRHKQRVKAELHCKVFELQEKLWELCDTKKNRSESKRQELISQNWLAVQLTMLANLFVLMIQVEANRFVDTLQLLYDYHVSSLGLLPPSDRINKIKVAKVPKIKEFSETAEELRQTQKKESSKTKRGSLSKHSRLGSSQKMLSKTFSESPFNSVMQLLLDVEVDKTVRSSVHSCFSELVDTVLKEVSETANKIKLKAEPVLKQGTQKKGKKSTAVPKSNKKKGLASKDQEPTYKEPEDPKERLFLEWETAVGDETRRATFRIKLIKGRALEDMSEIQSIMQTNFHGFYNDLVNIYKRDLSNIATLCTLLRTAIEEETPIQPELKLGQDKFRVDNGSLTLPNPPIPPPTPLRQLENDYLFTVQQLENLLEKLRRVSPIGIAKEVFLDILEDMKYFGAENGFSYLPKSWSQLSRKDLRNLLDTAFGDVLLIDWRDFLVFGLNVPFPTVEEVVEARQEFLARDPERRELVGSEDYESVTLWFEKDLSETLEEDLRRALTKRFLFDLYRINGNEINYTALLLGFCKDEDPVDGFGKALALATGYGYVLRPELIYLAEQETEEERKRKEAMIIAEQIELQLLTDAMQYALGVVVKEIEEEPQETNGGEEDVYEEEETPREYDYFGEWEGEEQTIEEEPPKISIKWLAEVSYEVVLTVFSAALRFYELSAEDAEIQSVFEKDLLKLFAETQQEKRLLSAHVLVRTPFMRNLFSRVHVFNTCDVTDVVYNLIASKYSISSWSQTVDHKKT